MRELLLGCIAVYCVLALLGLLIDYLARRYAPYKEEDDLL